MLDRSVIDRALSELPALEAALADATAAADRNKYRDLVRRHAALRRLQERAERYLKLQREAADHRDLIAGDDADVDLRELARAEIGEIEARLAAAEREVMLALFPPDPADARNAILEIRAGTGGEEASLFAADLCRMYTRYCENKGWRTGVIDASSSASGGYKEVVLSVEGANAYGALRFEGGVHRVQRVPATEASGRIHTSAATVAVFPEVEPDDDIEIDPNDLRIDIFRSSGPGGQSVNTADSAVRITHLPSGIVVQCQDERSQQRNKAKAVNVLKSRLLDLRQQAEAERMGRTRRSMIGSGDRSERIRTYNFPQNRLTDHRIQLTLYSLDRVMEGDIDELVEALHAREAEARLATGKAGV
ncbi:MAG: peptide chain release factor 1 [Lentisphaerae bacterium]|nr:peptide chain release factor 1 [Lentisphaerota bacterium]